MLKTFGQATGGVLRKSIKSVTDFTVGQIEKRGFQKTGEFIGETGLEMHLNRVFD